MNYLVFGSNGFLGKRLVRYLQEKQEEVIGVSRTNNAPFNVDIARVDTFECLQQVSADVIINCASVLPNAKFAINDTGYLKNVLDTNVLGAINLLNFAASKGIKKVINSSTLSVIDKLWPVPLTEDANTYPGGRHVAYSASKLTQELVMNEVAKSHNIQLIHLRLSALYGANMVWQGILPLLIDKAMKGETITLTNADTTSFDFLHVSDLSKIIYQLSQLEAWEYSVINVAAGQELFLNHLAEMVIQQTSSHSSIENKNEDTVSRSVVDISRLHKMLHQRFMPLPIEEGIKELITSYRTKNGCGI
jgi:nucleoside-diphosphate-sugar epimerase